MYNNKLLILSAVMVIGLLGCGNEDEEISSVNTDKQQVSATVPAGGSVVVTGDSQSQPQVSHDSQVPSSAVVVPPVSPAVPATPQAPQESQIQPVATAPIVEVPQSQAHQSSVVEQPNVGSNETANPVTAGSAAAVDATSVATAPIATGSEAQAVLPVDQSAGNVGTPMQSVTPPAVPAQQDQSAVMSGSAQPPVAGSGTAQ